MKRKRILLISLVLFLSACGHNISNNSIDELNGNISNLTYVDSRGNSYDPNVIHSKYSFSEDYYVYSNEASENNSLLVGFRYEQQTYYKEAKKDLNIEMYLGINSQVVSSDNGDVTQDKPTVEIYKLITGGNYALLDTQTIDGSISNVEYYYFSNQNIRFNVFTNYISLKINLWDYEEFKDEQGDYCFDFKLITKSENVDGQLKNYYKETNTFEGHYTFTVNYSDVLCTINYSDYASPKVM